MASLDLMLTDSLSAPTPAPDNEGKAIAAAVAARTEGLRQASAAMESAHFDLLDYSSTVDNILARLRVLEG